MNDLMFMHVNVKHNIKFAWIKIRIMYVNRYLESFIRSSIEHNPVTAIVGPRQSGKSTLAKFILNEFKGSEFLDLENPSDLAKLEEAQFYFNTGPRRLFCLDEIQRKPELFPLIRSLVDNWGGNGHFLILGSASRDLLRQSTESLAGRISFWKLPPFFWEEIKDNIPLDRVMSQGGFPRSILNDDPIWSLNWRRNFIQTFLERDLLFWSGVSPVTMRRLWQMLAHMNGQLLNYSQLSKSLGVSSPTVKNYIDLLESTFMVQQVKPYLPNVGKRLTKAPKLYFSDSGIAAALLDLENFSQLFGHAVYGSIWEGIVLAQIMGIADNAQVSFYRTSNGAEIDFVVKKGDRLIAIECKASSSPSLTKGNYFAISDIQPEQTLIVSPVKKGWPVNTGIRVVNLSDLVDVLLS